ncbi:vWA domain-containing protein [Candidatus Liberibacter africanus]|uniref:vWA domain-containing protein n=1 Tax=Liberibacter africanus TaxID=34020 RepID=UPI00339D4405
MFFLKIQNFFRNHAGGFSLLTAILLPIVIISIGIAIELFHIFYAQVEMHSIIDRALLNTALELAKKKNRFIVGRTVPEIWKNNFYNELVMDGFSTEIDDVMQSISLRYDSLYDTKNISVVSQYKVPFNACSLIPLCKNNYGYVTVPITSSMKISYVNENEADIMFVLDVSYSMGIIPDGDSKTRLDIAIKNISDILHNLQKYVNVDKVIRSGLVTFSTYIVDTIPLEWGVRGIEQKIPDIRLVYDTNSTPGLKYAYNQIFDENEEFLHHSRGHDDYKKYIIFLTDGRNNDPEQNIHSKWFCNEAKKKGAIVYVIDINETDPYAVNFLKTCASPGQFYFVENSNSMHNAFVKIGNDMTEKRIWYDK